MQLVRGQYHSKKTPRSFVGWLFLLPLLFKVAAKNYLIHLPRYIETIGNVVCPNKDLGELGSMNRYLKVVSDVDAVYATEFNGKQTSYKIIKKKVDKSGNLVQG